MSTEYSLPVFSSQYSDIENKDVLKSNSWDPYAANAPIALSEIPSSSKSGKTNGSKAAVESGLASGAFGNRTGNMNRNTSMSGYTFGSSNFVPYNLLSNTPSFTTSHSSSTTFVPPATMGGGLNNLSSPSSSLYLPGSASYQRSNSKNSSASILQMNTTLDDIPILLRRPGLSSYTPGPSTSRRSISSSSNLGGNPGLIANNPSASKNFAFTSGSSSTNNSTTSSSSMANGLQSISKHSAAFPLLSNATSFFGENLTPSLAASTASTGSTDSSGSNIANTLIAPTPTISPPSANTVGNPSPADTPGFNVPSLISDDPSVSSSLSSSVASLSLQNSNILSFCKDQHGCRYLQRLLEKKNQSHIDAVFAETHPYLAVLMVDAFGNYLCQKLFEHASEAQRSTFIQIIAPKLVPISFNMHGTRALQKIIDLVSSPDQISCIVNALRPNVVLLTKDLNGNHVIQKCLNKFSQEDCQFIFDAICEDPLDVSTHRHGCCVVQRCFDHASPAQIEQLVEHIVPHALTLVQDAFGNYVLQYVLELNNPNHTEAIISYFLYKVRALSTQKFSSNVMEKCIFFAPAAIKEKLISELMDEKHLPKLLRDSFANYVIQTALDNASVKQRAELVERIKPLIPSIKNTPCGRRILSKLERRHPSSKEKPIVYSNSERVNTSSSA